MSFKTIQIKEALRIAAEQFNNSNITSANLDARLLLAKTLGRSVEYLISKFDQDLTAKQYNEYLQLIKQRTSLEPIAYILGYKEFYSRDFAVDKKVLIPRSDTEIIVQAVIEHAKGLKDQREIKILELGVGSGAIAVTLAAEIINSKIIATDISVGALEIAGANSKHHSVERQITLLQSDWYKEIPQQKFDIIISNPPYISHKERHLMPLETKKFEPEEALYAEDNGLLNYNTIISGAHEYLSSNGCIFLELGFRQFEEVNNILQQNHFVCSNIFKDLRGFSRAIMAKQLRPL